MFKDYDAEDYIMPKLSGVKKKTKIGKKADVIICDDIEIYPPAIVSDFTTNQSISFVPFTTTGPCMKQETCSTEKENNMSTVDYTAENTRRYLLGRLREELHMAQCELNKAFHLVDDEAPKTPQEIVDRIKAGKFVLPNKDEDEDYYWGSAYTFIRWRDPEVKEDKEGAKAADKRLCDSFQTAKDIISVSDADKGLAALNEFKAKTFH